ncbi:MAG: TldD/PmbA family protein [Pseudomonadota bacterium]
MRDLSALSDDLLRLAKAAGADAADALAVDETSVSIDVLKSDLERAERSENLQVGLRVLVGRRQACVSTGDLRDAALRTLAERAVAMARVAPEDPHAGLADPADLAKAWSVERLDLVDQADPPSPDRLKEWCLRAEAAALAVDGVTQVGSAEATYGDRCLHLAATNGFSGGYRRTGTALSCMAISGSGTGMERDYYVDSRVHSADLDDPETVGRIAGERTAARAGARKPPTGAFPVIYDERVAGTVIGHLLQALNGASVARGASFLREAMGTNVLPDDISLREDPTLPRIPGSKPFDAEGLPVAARDLIHDGVLEGWVLDLSTGRKLNMASTGNATRGVKAPPSPRSGNVILTQGQQSRADLIGEMGTGLLITSMIGSSVNQTTGDYSRGASGFWVENGAIAYPVNECTVAGNLRDMLRNLRPANDARTHVGRQVPSLLIEGLTVAGG